MDSCVHESEDGADEQMDMFIGLELVVPGVLAGIMAPAVLVDGEWVLED